MKRLLLPMHAGRSMSLLNFPIALLVFLLSPFASHAADIFLEAENATLNGVTAANSPTGFSGTGFASGFDNATDNVTFNFNVPAADQYELTIGYYSPYGDKGYNL